eukprot:80915-Alexandrium_andersonii.AAC.1
MAVDHPMLAHSFHRCLLLFLKLRPCIPRCAQTSFNVHPAKAHPGGTALFRVLNPMVVTNSAGWRVGG